MVALEEVSTAHRSVAIQARVRAGFLFAAALAALLGLGGCISLPQSEALKASPPADLPAKVELTEVPHYRQDGEFLCGPAALAMAFKPAGVEATVESLTPMVYLPGREGSLQAEMLGATRRSGLVAYTLPPEFQAMLREVAAGTPVIALINLSVRLFPIWHYVVIVGYDLDTGRIIMRSGNKTREEFYFGFFEFLWRDSNYWSMVALPPGKVAASAQEQEFAAAVSALERVGHRAGARKSYNALLARWPTNLTGLFGLGNVEYALGDLKAAERAFRSASVAHPDSAPAFNNLAHTLAELGRLPEAEDAALTAVKLGGPTLGEAEKTLEEIRARRAKR